MITAPKHLKFTEIYIRSAVNIKFNEDDLCCIVLRIKIKIYLHLT